MVWLTLRDVGGRCTYHSASLVAPKDYLVETLREVESQMKHFKYYLPGRRLIYS